jgi:hypothetical protein
VGRRCRAGPGAAAGADLDAAIAGLAVPLEEVPTTTIDFLRRLKN